MPNLQVARTEFLRKLTEALTQALAWPTSPKPLVLVTAPGGIGKTRATAHLLRGHRVTWFAERNEMQAQLETFLSTPLAGVTPLAGPSNRVPTLEKRMAREDQGACSQYDSRVAPLVGRQLGRYVESMACRGCPDRARCVYQHWKPSKDWLFVPHVWLGLGVDHKHLFAQRDVVVIDESPMSEMLDGVTLTAWEMDLLLVHLRQSQAPNVAARAFTAVFEQALDLLKHPPPQRARVELRKLVEDLGYQFIAQLPSLRDMNRTQPVKKELETVEPWSVARVVDSLPRVPADVRAKLPLLADALAADVQARPGCVLVLPEDEARGGIAAGHFKPLPVPDEIPLVVLDATGDEGRYWCLLRPSPQAPDARPILRVDVDVDMASTIYQTVDHRYPSSTFSHPASTTIDRLMTIVDLYKNDYPAHRVALVVKKQLFLDNQHFRTRILQTVPNVGDVKFFWALRGDNSLEDYDAIFIVGAPELDSLEAEALVRAFMTRLDPDPGEPPYDYKPTLKDVPSLLNWQRPTDSHGRVVQLQERSYEGREQYAAWRLFYQDEFVQAILRGRPYDPAKKKNIFFFSNTFLTVLDVTYIREAELLRRDTFLFAKQVVIEWRADGNQGPMTQRQLAALMEVDESTISHAKKKDPESWELLLAEMAGFARA